MSAASHAEEDERRPAKRMRKGTRSCLACRRRKAKCIFDSEQAKSCLQCDQHKLQCIPQGGIDDGETSYKRLSKLKQRVDQLQSLVNQLVPNNREYAGTAGDYNDPLVKTLEDLLPGVQEAADAEQSAQAAWRLPDPRQAPRDHDELEEPLDSQTAPLMRLLGDEIQVQPPAPCTASQPAARGPKHPRIVAALIAAMPSPAEMETIFATRSSWWQLWRSNLDLLWGSTATDTLRSFAALAFAEADPALLAILLVAFAIATGDRARFLPPVEQHVVHHDALAGTEHGLSCLMILGLCYLNNLQPRRAWSVYRRANSLLQLNGIHLRHKGSSKRESIFWQLFHADRWVSLMIGLPYMVPDHLMDVSVGSVGDLSASTYLYRHLAVLTGRVVDCLNEPKGLSLSAALLVEQQLHEVLDELPPGYLDMEQIRACVDPANKMTRLYRAVHFHQLRAYLHVSFFLKPSASDRYAYSRLSCVADSRQLLEAYGEIFATDAAAASDGSVLNCTAFTAAVVLLMSAVDLGQGGGRRNPAASVSSADDWRLIGRTLETLRSGQSGIAGELCRQCYDALDKLVRCAQSEGTGGATIVLPFFGRITCAPETRGDPLPSAGAKSSEYTPSVDTLPSGVPVNVNAASAVPELNQPDGFHFDYSGPFSHDKPLTSWLSSDWLGLEPEGGSLPWNGSLDADNGWDWFVTSRSMRKRELGYIARVGTASRLLQGGLATLLSSTSRSADIFDRSARAAGSFEGPSDVHEGTLAEIEVDIVELPHAGTSVLNQ
ncbi:hypothetical protein LTR53_012429 [Teratosphaeriaceae sp. CCFEE 6253]|nr:hypothetical protein LTR53_012429 [Teratosphaeriaceae sp. CCFEE 6253]